MTYLLSPLRAATPEEAAELTSIVLLLKAKQYGIVYVERTNSGSILEIAGRRWSGATDLEAFRKAERDLP